MKTIFVSHRSNHHASFSGYDKLCDYYSGQIIDGSGNRRLPYKLAKLLSGFKNQKHGIYDSNSVYKDLELYKTLKKNNEKQTLVHYLNAERDIRYLKLKKDRFSHTAFCATFHKPPEVLKKEITNAKSILNLDGLIAVGNNQLDFLKNWLDADNVFYVPHGVNINFFKPSEISRDESSILFVGQHLRDFNALNQCIPVLHEKIKNLRVNVVLKKDFNYLIKPHKSITIHNSISDEKLRSFYQKSTLLFLPLLDSTACNSILEGMACGVPIISTNVGGNAAYFSNLKNQLVEKSNNEALIDAVLNVISNKDLQNKIQIKTRENALHYDWNVIVPKVKEAHLKIINRKFNE